MIPRSISASALKVAGLCMSRYKAEYIDYGRDTGSKAADLGTTCHLALERYVQNAIVNKTQEPTLQYLLSCYTSAYLEVMREYDFTTKLFKDGEKMMRVWHDRNDFEGVTVLSCEAKKSFDLPYVAQNGTKQKVKFNYICDRIDQISENEFRIVDYKSWRSLLEPDEVFGYLQARAYALAIQIEYPNAKRIWVMMDQLRGEEVGACFTRDDNVITFRSMKAALQRIVDTPPNAARETLNDECSWCVRKASCRALRKHNNVGGILDKNLDELVELYYELYTANRARSNLLDRVKERINAETNDLDISELVTLDKRFELNTGGMRGGRRDVDNARLPEVVGPEIALEIANYKISDVDGLRGDPRVSDAMLKQIDEITMKFPGKRQVTVKKLDPEAASNDDSQS